MALPVSKSCISLHLSANDFSYYDRVFLRTLINAKLSYKFKNFAQNISAITSQSEINKVMELNSGDYFEDDLRTFTKLFNGIEEQKLKLDE
jgi:hypothetical protein